MTEIIVEAFVNETVIDISGGPTLSTIVDEVEQTIVSEFIDPIVIDLNSGPQGEPGAAIVTGEYPPDPQTGVMGDLYIVTEGADFVGQVFRKVGPLTWEDKGNVRGPAGGVNTVNGYTGPDVTLNKDDIGLTNIVNLRQVDLENAQTIGGVKTFSSAPVVPNASFSIAKVSGLQANLTGLQGDINTRATDSTVVHLAGEESISGTKTFTVAPIVPTNSFAIDRIIGLQTALNSKSDNTHTHAYSSITGLPSLGTAAPLNVAASGNAAVGEVVKGNDTRLSDARTPVAHSHPISDVTNLQTSLNAKANDNAVVHLAGTETITGAKTFSQAVSINAGVAPPSTTTRSVGTRIVLFPSVSETQTDYAIGIQNSNVWYSAGQPSGGHKWYTGATETMGLSSAGTLTATGFVGSGAGLTGLTKAQVGLSNVANLAQVDTSTNQSIAGTKTFSVSPVVPTPTVTNQAANKSYVDATVSALVDSAPGTLDTLNELAAALGDDPNFATTVSTQIGTKEPIINAGTTAQYYRGDKAWATLNKAAVGLSSVDNTSDAAKPISTATQTALNTKVSLTGNETIAGTKTFSSAPVVPANAFTIDRVNGLQTALDAKQPTITAGTTAQYYRGDKTWQTLNSSSVGLGNVSNSAQVDLSSNQNVDGNKQFSGQVYIGTTSQATTIPIGGANLHTTQLTINSPTASAVGVLVADGAIANRSALFIDKAGGRWGLSHTYASGGFYPFVIKFASAEVVTITSAGAVSATSFTGSGAGLTGLTKTQVGLANVTNDAQVTLATTQTVTGAKTFTGAVIVPAPTADTHAAHKKYVDDRITSLIDTSPATLDTLNELAAALGDDPNFATTVTNQIATKEPVISSGTTAQYWRGDKSWQPLTKATVGLGNVDNTSDAAKPISTATQNALNGKANSSHSHAIADLPVATSGTSSATLLVRADDARLSNARTPLAHTHAITDTTGLQAALDAKANTAHAHTIANVTGLQAALDSKSASTHTHPYSAITGLPTLGTAAALDVPTSGDASVAQVVKGNDSRLVNARTPLAHTHTKANITDFAHTHAIADLPVAASGVSSSTLLVRADDARLSDARTPTTHTHDSFSVVDVRNMPGNTGAILSYMPTPTEMPHSSVTSQFAYVANGGPNWRGVLSVKGWSGAYASYQLIGPAGSTSDEEFYLRSGYGETWGTPRKILHSGNLDVDTIVYQSGNQTIAGTKTFSSSPIVPTPTTATQVANKGYVDSTVSNLVDAAPGTLDTLNELAAALGDDPNFATTVSNQIGTKEPVISAGTTAQYWRGDKSWQTLNAATVGLGNVNNTSDLAKPISTATQTALNGKADTGHAHTYASITGKPTTFPPEAHNHDDRYFTQDAVVLLFNNSAPLVHTHAIGDVTNLQASLNAKQDTIAVGTAAQYFRGDKTWATLNSAAVGLGNVNNTSDAAKPVSTAQQTALNLKADLTATTTLAGAQTITGAKTFSALITASAGITITGTATATTFSGSGASLTSLNGSNISTGTVAQARMVPNVQRFVFTTAGTARPAGATYVEWMGPVQPTNMAANDTWINTGA